MIIFNLQFTFFHTLTKPPLRQSVIRVALLANIKPEGIDLWNRTSSGVPDDTYAEWDTRETIEAVCAALNEHPHVECHIVDANPVYAIPKLMDRSFDIVFNIAEGMRGAAREAQYPALMEMLGIPYTGSGPWTLATALDKVRTKEILDYYQIPVARFVQTRDHTATLTSLMSDAVYPLVVKPVAEGSSKGVTNSSFVNNDTELQREVIRIDKEYDQQAIVEEFLPGREFTVAVLGNGSNTRVLPIVEINLEQLPHEANSIYSYEAKWVYDTQEHPLNIFTCPAEIDSSLQASIENIVLNTYHALECRDWSRIDVRCDAHGVPHIIEINPLPGILPNPEDNSCFPKAARTAGIDYAEMLHTVLRSAAQRYKIEID